MQRLLPRGLAAVLSIITLSLTPACKGDEASTKDQADKAGDAKAADEGEDAGAEAGAAAEAGAGQGEIAAAEGGAAPEAGAEGGAPAEAGAAAEAGAPDEAGAEVAADTAGEDPVPGLFEQAKSLDTDDATAKKALEDAVAAGGAKLDAAKIANERGEALMAKGEGERAEALFRWAADTHKLFAEPVYNLATLAAYAGDLEIAKEHLQELAKRNNKKLMKKVGVDPAFAPLVDDPDVRKIYEQ